MSDEREETGGWVDEADEDYDALADEASGEEETAEGGEAPDAAGGAATAGDGGEQEPPDEETLRRQAQERLGDLIERMPGQRALLLRILDLCREQQAVSAVNDQIAEWQRLNHSVYTPTKLCELLQDAGGLRHVNEDGTDWVPPEQRAAAEPSETPGAADEAEAASDAVDAPAEGEGALEREAAQEDGVEFRGVERPPETYWLATPAGVAVADGDNPRDRLAKLLADDACYLPVYREILENLADEPRTKRDLDAIVRSNPLTQSPRRLTGYFLDRLERAEAIEWADPWSITDLGRQALEDGALDA